MIGCISVSDDECSVNELALRYIDEDKIVHRGFGFCELNELTTRGGYSIFI